MSLRVAAFATLVFFFFLLIPPPPRSTLFPYTTLFRSADRGRGQRIVARGGARKRESADCHKFSRTGVLRSEEHTSELQSLRHLVCRLLLEKKKQTWSTSHRCRTCRPSCRASSHRCGGC